jgi:hypothetical protein
MEMKSTSKTEMIRRANSHNHQLISQKCRASQLALLHDYLALRQSLGELKYQDSDQKMQRGGGFKRFFISPVGRRRLVMYESCMILSVLHCSNKGEFR